MDDNIHYINKQTLQVVLFTNNHKLKGHMHVLYNHRALDMLNARERFIALTDVTVSNINDGELLFKSEFIAINKNEIVFLYEK